MPSTGAEIYPIKNCHGLVKDQVYLKEYEVYKAYREPLRIWLSVPDLVSGPLAIYITSIFAFLEVFGMWGGSKMAYSLASS